MDPLLAALALVVAALCCALRRSTRAPALSQAPTLALAGEGEREAPTPSALPVVGHLHLLAGHDVPYAALTELTKKYGPVVSLRLGVQPSLVVGELELIREVLIARGHHFDSRPDFRRYHELFSGDKENSLAFSDFSEVQKTRRDMLRSHTFPRSFTPKFSHLGSIICDEVAKMAERLPGDTAATEAKPLVLQACANIFASHFCSRSFDFDDASFLGLVADFDEIFHEVNQGYAADFLPWLMPLHARRLGRMRRRAHSIRRFIETAIVGGRFHGWSADSEPADYLESLIGYVQNGQEPRMGWDTALFALEDILGGHSAVGNFLVKVLAYLVVHPEVQQRVQEEIEAAAGHRPVNISDRNEMPYTEAVLFEAIRLIASPIVPRVANQDTTLGGYRVAKGTMMFLNNYELSMSEKLWDEPKLFKPERFLVNGRLVKPEHFLPFGGGRRSCMGYKMVQMVGFGLLAGILQMFTIEPAPGQGYHVAAGSLALPTSGTYRFRFRRR